MNSKFLDSAIFLTRSKLDLIIALASLVFLGLVHRMERHENMRRFLSDKPAGRRFAFYYIIVAGILLLSLPDMTNFIYFQF